MKNFKSFVENFEKLGVFIDSGIHVAYLHPASSIHLFSNVVATKAIALKVRGQKDRIIVTSEWIGDTEDQGLDCHQMTLNISEEVDFIREKVIHHNDNETKAVFEPLLLQIYQKESKIEKIELYSCEESLEMESVEYDNVLVFYVRDNNPLIVQCIDGIQGGLSISSSLEGLSIIKKEYILRKSL